MEVDVLALFPDALKNEEFLVYYQPKVSLRNYRLAGAEALVRWKHGDSFIFPDQFIPTLEKDGAICELDFYMLDHVCANLRRWLDQGHRLFKVSVNLSRAHLRDEKLVERIVQTIDNHNVPHEYIEIELTETTTDVGFAELRKVIDGLHAQMISTSVDDFGMGYSSMNLIRDLPWDVLKIDKCFLPKSENDRRQYVMLKHIISLAQDIGLDTIVEGVETIEHVKML
ncbi:MAG: EAL domain-containing protein, partial [Treponema sp.]|nr:EAL domain-containing protein [Treponema sp.]